MNPRPPDSAVLPLETFHEAHPEDILFIAPPPPYCAEDPLKPTPPPCSKVLQVTRYGSCIVLATLSLVVLCLNTHVLRLQALGLGSKYPTNLNIHGQQVLLVSSVLVFFESLMTAFLTHYFQLSSRKSNISYTSMASIILLTACFGMAYVLASELNKHDSKTLMGWTCGAFVSLGYPGLDAEYAQVCRDSGIADGIGGAVVVLGLSATGIAGWGWWIELSGDGQTGSSKEAV
jgi:hypothetical protein